MTFRCHTCNAEIRWAEIDGKRIPLNKRRVRAYEVYKERWTTLHVGDLSDLHPAADNLPPPGTPHLVHISHFITCPQASSHSKSKT